MNLDLDFDFDSEKIGDMDILELMSRDIDIKVTSVENKKKISDIKKNQLIPDDGMSLCFSCSNMVNCPKGIDSTKMESVFSCTDYENMNKSSLNKSINEADDKTGGTKEPICGICSNMMNCPLNLNSTEMETIFSCEHFISLDSGSVKVGSNENIARMKAKSKSPLKSPYKSASKSTSSLSNQTKNNDKQDLISEIMKEWEEQKGELKIFCKKCEMEMNKIITLRKEFYRCSNYPECKITADPWYIGQAVKKKVISHVEHGDLLILYQYYESKNIVVVSQIYSEGKLFT